MIAKESIRMDKPQVTVGTNRQVSDNTYGQFRSLPPRMGSEGGKDFFSWMTGSGKTRIFLPALLAVITGVMLGMCLLVVFKGQSVETPALAAPATSNGQATTPSVAGKAQVPGVTLYAWQVGSFTDRAPAEKQQKEFEQKGVAAVIRGGGPFQLFAGVAADKNAGAAIGSELQKLQVAFYAKEYKIEARQGTIAGLEDADATQVSGMLAGELKLAEGLLPLAIQDKRDAEKVAAISKQIAAVDVKKHTALLDKAGLTEQSAGLSAMHQKLTETAQALSQPGLLSAPNKLASFYVTYESLAQKLIFIE
jgi:hypothetical protein